MMLDREFLLMLRRLLLTAVAEIETKLDLPAEKRRVMDARAASAECDQGTRELVGRV